MQTRFLVLLCALLVSTASYSQTEYTKGHPLFPFISSWYNIDIDRSQIDLLRSVDQPKDQPYQFAIPALVFLNPENAGFIVPNGDETVWIMPIESKEALSLNAILEPFNLPEGAYLYIYDNEHKIVRGAYTRESGNASVSMPLLPVPGDKMVIECHFPGSKIPSGTIGVRQVAHDFAGFFRMSLNKDGFYGASGACEVDINCSYDANFLKSARSVCRLLINGTTLCTGSLVNNTGQVFKAYVLTAQHCIQTNLYANNTIFLFNYSSPWCDGPDQRIMHSISGSLLKATNQSVDFSLVELISFPSLVFKPYLAGWDISSAAPETTYAIHHPEGDVMKLSRDNNPPVSASYPIGDYLAGAFWKILMWDLGTTETGSSGGPLFDQNNRIRGTLTGGSADCINPAFDYYAKISRMFDVSIVQAQNLKTWLDPSSTGVNAIGGLDPYAYNLSRSDTITNIPENEAGMTDQYVTPAYGYSTGINSDSIISYAEYIPFSGTGEITWVRLNVAYASWITGADSVKIFVCNDGSAPGTVIASRTLRIEAVKDNYDLEIDFGRTIKVTGPFYIGYRVFYKSPLASSQTQFAVKHTSPYTLESSNTAWFNDGSGWKPFTLHPSFPMSTSLFINTIMVENSILNSVIDVSPQENEVTVFPNPFTESLSFRVDSAAESTLLELYDHSGNTVSSYKYINVFPGTLTLELPFLIPGAYHYRLVNDSAINTGTVIKIDK